jgi:hypothetical protein
MPDAAPIEITPSLPVDERRALRCLVALMIPASAEYGVPGADDDAIFADILRSLGRDAQAVRQALRELEQCAAQGSRGTAFADLPERERVAAAQRLRETRPALASVLVAVTTRCYYRDDRVMRSLGMEPRPPFPEGFEVEPGDWSLLEPVRARGRIYRDAT